MEEIFKDDLENRTYVFTINVIGFVKSLQNSSIASDKTNQLMISAAIFGKHFMELRESTDEKTYSHKINICRDEAKKSLSLLNEISCNEQLDIERKELISEVLDFIKVFEDILQVDLN